MPFLTGSPWWLRKYYPNFLWSMPVREKKIYLSFDDGPLPVTTPFVLDTLKEFNAKASFFCIGKNVQQYPDIYHRVLEEGHTVGNHSFNHLNGWKTKDDLYVDNILKAGELIASDLFRPPYGRIKKSQAEKLRIMKPEMKVVMWSVLSGDFDVSISGEDCRQIVKSKAGDGAIIVFHDTEKAFDRLRFCLPETLKHFAGRGFSFEKL